MIQQQRNLKKKTERTNKWTKRKCQKNKRETARVELDSFINIWLKNFKNKWWNAYVCVLIVRIGTHCAFQQKFRLCDCNWLSSATVKFDSVTLFLCMNMWVSLSLYVYVWLYIYKCVCLLPSIVKSKYIWSSMHCRCSWLVLNDEM